MEQIDFIDSCVGEEEEEEGRSRGRGGRGGGAADGTSLSSQFMAYIERRITREVRAPPTRTHSYRTHGFSPERPGRRPSESCVSQYQYQTDTDQGSVKYLDLNTVLTDWMCARCSLSVRSHFKRQCGQNIYCYEDSGGQRSLTNTSTSILFCSDFLFVLPGFSSKN